MDKKPGLLSELKHDLPASLVVFLVALPLCLGIALASGAEPMAGLIAGIVGGIVVGAVSGSPLGVSGPAAGLTIIVLHAIQTLGGYPTFLTALVLAAVMQVALGAIRAGVLAYYFPSAVIKGMLSGIGVIIILKQIPHAVGYNRDFEGDESFVQPGGETTLSALSHMLNYINEGSILIACVALGLLILWERPFIKQRRLGAIPGPLLAVLSGIVLGKLLPSKGLLAMDSTFFVNLPEISLGTAFSVLPGPNWSALANPAVWKVAFTLAVVASLETLLCVEATDKMDRFKRVTPTNRELVAQGVGNGISALLGGLPLTQVIVRSSANVQNGGRTKMSAILHGAWLLLAVLLIPGVLRAIPLASLAAILLVVGYKLAHPKVFASLWKAGRGQFIPFAATILGVVFTDLLTGVLIGLGIGIFTILYNNYKIPFHFDPAAHVPGQPIRIELSEDVSFLNKVSILRTLDRLPRGARVLIDGRRNVNLDPDVREIIQDAVVRCAQAGINLEVGGLAPQAAPKTERLTKVLERIVQNEIKEYEELKGEGASNGDMAAMRRLRQERMSPAKAFETLIEGNRRFVSRQKRERVLQSQIEETAAGQFPFGVVLACIDSRVPTELVFDLGVGDVFTIRVAGNTVNSDILGSMEFACKVAGAKHILVLGHTRCGAVKGACDGVRMGNLSGLLEKLDPVVKAVAEAGDRTSHNHDFVERVAAANVEHVLRSIPEQSPILRELLEQGRVSLAGAIYDVASGAVNVVVPPRTLEATGGPRDRQDLLRADQ
jgi:carbonic anhydrase